MTLKVQLKIGFKSADLLSQHAALVDVVGSIFGTSEEKVTKPSEYRDVTAGVGTYEQAVGAMNNLLKFG